MSTSSTPHYSSAIAQRIADDRIRAIHNGVAACQLADDDLLTTFYLIETPQAFRSAVSRSIDRAFDAGLLTNTEYVLTGLYMEAIRSAVHMAAEGLHYDCLVEETDSSDDDGYESWLLGPIGA